MASSSSMRPSSRYSSVSSSSEPSPSSSDVKKPSSKLSSLNRLISHKSSSTSRRHNQSDSISTATANPASALTVVDNNSRALVAGANRNNKNATFGTMVKKFMETKKKIKSSKVGSGGDRAMMPLPLPVQLIRPDAEVISISGKPKSSSKTSNFTALHRKLFQNGGSAGRSSGALTEVKPNTRTLAMVLRSERELLNQNKCYEEEVQELRLLLQEKNREVEKLKDLCLNQRQEIKALKDAILFPDVMNSQLHQLLEEQGSELKEAREIIPSLQKQVSSLTGQLQCLADDLAEVKADKYTTRTCFDGYISSPQTPKSDSEAQNSLEYSSGCPLTFGSPDEMFLKDLNPCLTPCFSKTKSKEYDQMLSYESPNKGSPYQDSTALSPDQWFNCRGGILSKSSEMCQPKIQCCRTARKIYKSDESKLSTGKPNTRKYLL